uniref:Uncharacterized protein n=1 Tax=Anguilla anguilla TaxID=7936 RepID=A0A0E9VR40_ANGAN
MHLSLLGIKFHINIGSICAAISVSIRL